jgi:hypothetical protein
MDPSKRDGITVQRIVTVTLDLRGVDRAPPALGRQPPPVLELDFRSKLRPVRVRTAPR